MDKFKDQKIWVSKKIVFSFNTDTNIVSAFIPKIFRYDIEILHISSQHLSYDELKYLATGVKESTLTANIIKYDNGEEVPLENIIKLFSGAKKVAMCFAEKPCNSCKCYDNLIDACQTIKNVELLYLPPIFDVPQFYQHLKRTKNRCIFQILAFNNREHLKEIVDEILETKTFEFLPPLIYYGYFSRAINKKMEDIQAAEAAKYQ